MENKQKRIHIFLCYANEDTDKIEEYYRKLSNEGFSPWAAFKDISPGEKWEIKIEDSIKKADFFMIFLSKNSIDKRGWLQKELRIALRKADEHLESDIYIIPLRLDDAEINATELKKRQWLNLFEEGSWAELVKTIKTEYARRNYNSEELKPKKYQSSEFSVRSLFFRGAGPGTYWHENDARISGFSTHSKDLKSSIELIINHIAKASTYDSPYISVVRSYGVAHRYATVGKSIATKRNPGYVYEIEFSAFGNQEVTMIDPVLEIVNTLPPRFMSPSHPLDAISNFLGTTSNVTPLKSPPGSFNPLKFPSDSSEAITILTSLRDTEILVLGEIPRTCIMARYSVY